MSRHTSDRRPPETGDLYVLAETAGFPVEWAVLDAPAGGDGRYLAVPADTNPLAGSADVEILANEPAGPLSLRCRFALWLDAARFDPDRRTGALAPDAVARALEKKAALEAGDPAASPLAWEVDADPEYEDWVREVLIPAHAALALPAAREAPAVRARPIRSRWSAPGNPYAALAASILLMVTLGLAGGLLWQTGKITDLAHRSEEELRRERERHAGELRQTEEAHRREIAERERLTAQREQEDRNRIADLEQRLDRAGQIRPLVNAPFAYLSPKDPVRSGEPEIFIVPPGASYLFLVLIVNEFRPFPEYRLEISNKDTGKAVWASRGLHRTNISEISVALPRDLLPPGDYRFRLFGLKDGKAEPVGEYERRIAEK